MPCKIIEPVVGLLIDRFDEPGVFETFSKKLCEAFLDAAHHTDVDTPYFRVFMHRNAGIQIVHALLAADAADDFPPARPIAFSLSATARRFRVSRIHVRRLIDAAEREGLLRYSDDGMITLEPMGRKSIDTVFATQMIRFLMVAGRTMKAGLEQVERVAPASVLRSGARRARRRPVVGLGLPSFGPDSGTTRLAYRETRPGGGPWIS